VDVTTLESWISQARHMLAREEDYPLISSREINMDDQLSGVWRRYSEQRSVLESAYARCPEDTASRFVALNFLYRLELCLQDPVLEALYEDECDGVREDLKFFIRLAEPDRLEDLRTIRWEIVNACAIKDYERAARLYDRIEHLGLLSDAEAHALRGQFHFLVVFLPRWELQDDLLTRISDLDISWQLCRIHERLYSCGFERNEDAPEAGTQWVRNKTSHFSFPSTPR